MKMYMKMKDRVIENLTIFQKGQSGWRFRSIVCLNVFTVEYRPLKGSSYIPLPQNFKNKTAIINMKNEDKECFEWSVTRALNPKDKNSEKVDDELIEQAKELNWEGINFPASWKDIDKFEKNNRTISVNVFGYEKRHVYPLRISNYKRETDANLLLIDNGEKQHYCLIKDINSLQYKKRHFCLRCLNDFPSDEALKNHAKDCNHNDVENSVLYAIEYKLLEGSSESLKGRGVINIKNEDNQSLKYAITRAINPKNNHPERTDKKLLEQAKELNWNDMNFPASWKDIDEFEKNNPTISVNVYEYEEDVYPQRISKYVYKRETDVNLLCITNEGNHHYCVIKDMSRFLYSQATKHHGRRHYCLRCLNGFVTVDSLNFHLEYCNQHDVVKLVLPKDGEKLSFEHFNRKMKVPIIVYADFEAFTKPIDGCQPNPEKSYTEQYQKHIPSSFCYYIKCFDDTIYEGKLVTYTAMSEEDDVAQIFIDWLEKDVQYIYDNVLKPKKEMIFTEEDEKRYNTCMTCHICGKGGFNEGDKNKMKVRDHCHLTGKFRGAAHSKCNLGYQIPMFIPVVFITYLGTIPIFDKET